MYNNSICTYPDGALKYVLSVCAPKASFVYAVSLNSIFVVNCHDGP